MWRITDFPESAIRHTHAKGLRDIARLIECPGSRLNAFELASANGAADSGSTEGVERARVAVTMRLRNALGRIKKEHHALGQHLSRAIKTGAFCTYEPETSVTWKP